MVKDALDSRIDMFMRRTVFIKQHGGGGDGDNTHRTGGAGGVVRDG
jgi:hypothetical protein